MRYKVIIIATLLASLWLSLCGNLIESYTKENNGDYPGAIQEINKLLEKEPNDPFFNIRLAWLQYQNAQYSDALISYTKSASMLDNLDARIGMINCQLALGNYREAIKIADTLLQTHKQNPTLISKAAYAAYMLKDYSLAAAYYSRMIEIYPWDMESRGYLVNNLYLAGKTSDAKKQYQTLKKYYPQSQIISLYKDLLD